MDVVLFGENTGSLWPDSFQVYDFGIDDSVFLLFLVCQLLAYDGTADISVFSVCYKQDSFDVRVKSVVHGSDGLLILQVFCVADTAEDKPYSQLVT